MGSLYVKLGERLSDWYTPAGRLHHVSEVLDVIRTAIRDESTRAEVLEELGLEQVAKIPIAHDEAGLRLIRGRGSEPVWRVRTERDTS